MFTHSTLNTQLNSARLNSLNSLTHALTPDGVVSVVLGGGVLCSVFLGSGDGVVLGASFLVVHLLSPEVVVPNIPTIPRADGFGVVLKVAFELGGVEELGAEALGLLLEGGVGLLADGPDAEVGAAGRQELVGLQHGVLVALFHELRRDGHGLVVEVVLLLLRVVHQFQRFVEAVALAVHVLVRLLRPRLRIEDLVVEGLRRPGLRTEHGLLLRRQRRQVHSSASVWRPRRCSPSPSSDFLLRGSVPGGSCCDSPGKFKEG
mmetsp:Transcript_12590/g.41264  ORF Transcript_12590/g.41264 Transcript_12590/m.41264 type:complete len:261 (-) Transcript_12590:163-945(-)